MFTAIYSIAVFLFLMYLISLGMVLIIIGFIATAFFSKPLFAKWGGFLQSSFLQLFVIIIEVLLGIRVVISGDELPKDESSLVLPNHLTHDWAPLYCMAYRQGLLGYVKTVIKSVVSYIPGFGWSMWLLYWPFVSRDWEKDAVYLKNLFEEYPRMRIPVQLWLFAEGTRQTQKKLLDSQKYASANGYPALRHVMLPRPKGFCTAVRCLRGSVDNVYDVTLAYEGFGSKTPSITELMKPARVDRTFHIHVRRLPMSALPTSDEELKKWLLGVFEDKDKVLEHYYTHGSMPGPQHKYKKYTLADFIPTLVMWTTVGIVGTWMVCRIFIF